MIVEIGNYQIRPYENGLCWEVFQFRDVNKKDGTKTQEWVSEHIYPSTLEHSFEMVCERMLKQGNNVVDIKEAIKQFRSISTKIGNIGKELQEVVKK